MSIILTGMLILTGIGAMYWVFFGERKHREMMNPPRKTKLKAILFDMDGVIVNSYSAWFLTFNTIRKEMNLKEFSNEKFKKEVWGGSVEKDAKLFFKTLSKEELESKYLKIMQKSSSKVKLMDGTEEVLNKINQKNLMIGLVTNSYKDVVNKILIQHKIKNKFDVIVTGDDVENNKPHPEPIWKACEKLKVLPDEVLYVGDTKIDYKAGKSAGAMVVGLNTKGDIVISDIRDIVQLI